MQFMARVTQSDLIIHLLNKYSGKVAFDTTLSYFIPDPFAKFDKKSNKVTLLPSSLQHTHMWRDQATNP
jgi:hypothetical protein